MAINEIRTRFTLTDNFSSTAEKINSKVDGFRQKLMSGSNAMNSFSKSASVNTKSMTDFEKSLQNTDAVLNRLIYSTARYMVIYKGIAGLGAAWDNVVGGAYRYSKMLETNTIGVAGILTSMTKLNGEQLKWNDAMGISASVMKKLQSEALRTAATSEDLMEVFQAILGPGMAAGMNIDEVMKLSTVGVNAVKSLGLPHNQLVQELRDLVQGGIRPASSTLATALGLKDADITAAKNSSEGLFKFLMRRLEGFDKSVGATSESVAGRIARIEEGLHVGLAQGSAELYNFYNSQLGKVADAFIEVKTTTDATGKEIKTWQISPRLTNMAKTISSDLGEALKSVEKIGSVLSGPALMGFSMVGSAAHLLATNVGKITTAFLAFKGAKWITDILNVINGKGMFAGDTVVGKMFNFAFYETFTAASKQVKVLIGYQEELNTLTEQYMGIVGQHRGIEGALKGSATSVYNLARYYEALGVSAEHAAQMQERAVNAIKGMSTADADRFLQNQRNTALAVALSNERGNIHNSTAADMAGAQGRVLQEQAAQKAALDNISGGARSEESVLNLAKAYKKLGVAADEAAEMQKKVQQAVLEGHTGEAERLMAEGEAYALKTQHAKEQETALKKLYSTQLSGIDKVINAQKQEYELSEKIAEVKHKVKEYYDNQYISSFNKEYLNNIIMSMKEYNFSEQRKMDYITRYMDAAKTGTQEQMFAIKDEMMMSIERLALGEEEIAQKKALTKIAREYASVDYSKMSAEQMKLLEFDAQHIMNLTAEKSQVEAVNNAFMALKSAEQNHFLTTEQSENIRIDLLKQVATGHMDIAAAIAKEIELSYQQGQLNIQNAEGAVARRAQEIEASQRILAMDAKELEMADRKILEAEALRKIRLTGDNDAITGLQRVIANEEKLEATMKKRGMSEVEASTAYIELLKEIATTQDVVISSKIKDLEITQKQTEAQLGHVAGLSKVISKTTSLMFATTMLGDAIVSATDSQDSMFGKMIEGAGIVANLAIGVDALASALEGLSAKALLAKASLISFGVAAAAAVVYKAYSDYELSKQAGTTYTYNDLGQVEAHAAAPSTADFRRQEDLQQAKVDYEKKMNELQLAFPRTEEPTGGRSGGGAGKSDAEKEAEKAKKRYEDQVRSINDLTAELSKKVLEKTGITSEIEMAKLSEELEKYKSKISKAEGEGVDTEGIKSILATYTSEAEKKLKEKEIDDKHKLDMDYINTRLQLGVYSADQAQQMQEQELTSYRTYLQERLTDASINVEQRLALEKKLAETVTALNQAQATDYETAWKNAMENVKKQRYDLQSTMESGVQSFKDTLSNFGQNMLTSTESFAQQVDNLFKDLANNIYNTMMKVLMQGLINKMLGGMFGQVPGHADGGYATGWSIVGERGPELVNFSQPGRVYNSEQTARALSGAGGAQNVKVVIENKSGQEVKATQATTQVNAKEMIIGVVIDAVSKNDGGINNILKGAIA